MRNDLTWLHISDIHFYPKTEWRDNIARQNLLTYLQKRFEHNESPRPDLVFCTGDIAYGETDTAPLAEQYEQAASFFDELLTICGHGDTPLSRERLFVVPGNHDVNRQSINDDAQATLTKWAEASADHEAVINQRFESLTKEFLDAIGRLAEYARFVEDFLPHQKDPDSRQCYAQVIDVEGLRVGVAGFNSAWSCAGPEDDRNLWLPASWQFNAAMAAISEADVRFGLIHHPVDWLNLTDRRLSMERISKEFDFWLHGHDHATWVVPVQTHIEIAAGAVTAENMHEFSFNLGHLEFREGESWVELHYRRNGQNDWTILPVPQHAPAGVWRIQLPTRLRESAAISVVEPSLDLESRRPVKLYGREKLLEDAASKLDGFPFLLVYGLRGNGKSAVIEELAKREPLAGKAMIRIMAGPATTADEVFRQLASALGETAEFPQAPTGDPDSIAAAIAGRYPNPQPAWIWVDRAHVLLSHGEFVRPEVRKLFLGLQGATQDIWHWVFEMRERPPEGLFGQLASDCKVRGLDKHSLRDCLADAAPEGEEESWHYSINQVTDVYQWLGGGHGSHAHSHATRLLIEVARGKSESPLDVREHHRGDLEQRVEDILLGDLYSNVLDEAERLLLRALALYRAAIPHDHADALEEKLCAPGAWDALDRRCLLSSSPDHHYFYLHSLIGGWVRTSQLGYADGENPETGFLDVSDDAVRRHARELHSSIATCWLGQLGSAHRPTNVNIERALEAFHHLVEAGDADRVQHIAIGLLKGNLAWARERMREFQESLYRTRAPLSQQRAALEYRAILDPGDHSVQRFLGECWQRIEGEGCDEALSCFENACRLRSDFPPYWANLGKAARARGPEAVARYLSQLDSIEQECPGALDEFVLVIKADCLSVSGNPKKASELRMAQIEGGSRNSAFYCDEAKALLDADDADGALRILDLAKSNGCENEYTEAIRGSALQQSDPKKASELRMAQIEGGSRNSVFYCDEAKTLLDADDADGALRILDLAKSNGCADEYTEAIRASALQQSDP